MVMHNTVHLLTPACIPSVSPALRIGLGRYHVVSFEFVECFSNSLYVKELYLYLLRNLLLGAEYR